MELKTPQSLKIEHEELHDQLSRATKAGGATSEAAKAVARELQPHFLKEEEYALPQLGLLPILAKPPIRAIVNHWSLRRILKIPISTAVAIGA